MLLYVFPLINAMVYVGRAMMKRAIFLLVLELKFRNLKKILFTHHFLVDRTKQKKQPVSDHIIPQSPILIMFLLFL